MSDIREHRFTGDEQVMLVEGSVTGNETIHCIGDFGGGTVQLQLQLVMRDGTTTSIVTFPEAGEYTSNFSKVVEIGKGSNLYINLVGSTSPDFIIKVFTKV